MRWENDEIRDKRETYIRGFRVNFKDLTDINMNKDNGGACGPKLGSSTK